MIILLILSLILGFLWIHKYSGFKKSKYYIFAISLCFIIILAGNFNSNNQTRNEYSYISIDNINRQFIIHLPPNYDFNTTYPLLVALHGGTGNAKQFESQSNFDSIADKENFIVVYPDGLGLFEFNFHIWNSGYIKTDLTGGVNDVDFLYKLIESLKVQYSIDSSKIFMTGHSNGAMMTYRMAAEYPNLFSGIAPVSGSIGGKTSSEDDWYIIPHPNSSLNVVAIHGLLDTNILYNGGITQTGYNAGERYDYSVNQSINFWIKNNKCLGNSTLENSSNNKITLISFKGCENNTSVELVTLNYANHFWERMNEEVKKEIYYGSSLAEMIWNLLEKKH
jgi:polyhydroxybutyrate depolymerase